jgi:hypothetical protein
VKKKMKDPEDPARDEEAPSDIYKPWRRVRDFPDMLEEVMKGKEQDGKNE